LDEDHFRVLVHFSKSGLENELKRCRIAGIVAEGLTDVLGRNRAQISRSRLAYCEFDNSVLANEWRGNSRLKSLRSRILTRRPGHQELLATTGA
jgi:hypothetical protein